MDEFKILLGTELDESSLNSISSKLKNIKVDPIKIKLDTSDVQKQIASIKSQLAHFFISEVAQFFIDKGILIFHHYQQVVIIG